eukprot:gene2529-2893_t
MPLEERRGTENHFRVYANSFANHHPLNQSCRNEVWPHRQRTHLGLTAPLPSFDYFSPHLVLTMVYDYCSSQNDGVLKDLYPRIEALLKSNAREIMKSADNLSNDDLLLFFRNKWNDWKFSCRVLKNLLEPVNKIWTSDTKTAGASAPQNTSSSAQVSKIYIDGLNAWRDAAFIPLNGKLSGSLLKIVQNDREGDSTNLQVLADTLECYVQLGSDKNKLEVYQTHFEEKFLAETKSFFTAESADHVLKNGIPQYMRHISRRVEQERSRVQKFMPISTLTKLDPLLNETLIINFKEQFAEKFLDLLTENKEDELAMMYMLLLRVNHLDTLKVKLQEFIRAEGLKEIEKDQKEAQEKPQVLVKILLDVWNRFNHLIKTSFNNDPQFLSAMDRSFATVVNENVASYDPKKKESTIPVVLSKFCDQILKKGPYHISDETELEKKLTEAVCLFRYLPDKDIFMLNYHKMLSKRLVEDHSASEDAEASMINKLKTHQGFDYCTKLTRMINDMRLSKDINSNFQNYLNDSNLTLPYTFNFYVLTHGCWSLTNKTSTTAFKPPSEMLSSITYFDKFYKQSYKGRVLTFLYDFSRADVDSRVVKGKMYKLSTTAYQMAILFMLNNADKITRFQILDTIGLDENSVRLPLLSLIKTQVIECDVADYKLWNNDTTFTVNNKFTSKKMKVNCNIAVQIGEVKTSEGAQTVSNAEIEKERYFKLQAAIVRIMKSKKTMTHNELVVEATTQVSKWFSPKIATIKKAIEYLIEQEYIRRTADDNPNQRNSTVAANGPMIGSKDLVTLLSLLSEEDKPLETVSTTFNRTFNKNDHFKIGCAIYTMMKDGFIRVPTHRLISFYILYSLYKNDHITITSSSSTSSSSLLGGNGTHGVDDQQQQEDNPSDSPSSSHQHNNNNNNNSTSTSPLSEYPIVYNPFFPIFIDELEKQLNNEVSRPNIYLNPIEKLYLCQFLTHLPKDFSKKTPKEVEQQPPTTTDYPIPDLEEYKRFYLERLDINITLNELSLFSFEPSFNRPPPPLYEPVEPIWLSTTITHGLLTSPSMGFTSVTNPKKVVRDLVAKAIRGRLKKTQIQQIKTELDLDPKLVLYSGLVPKKLPYLVEHNTQVAIDALLKLIHAPDFKDYFQELISMEMNYRSMEVVNALATSVELPNHFIPMYISNCITTCNNSKDKAMLQRSVRLVCVFIQSLIRNNIINIKDLFAEVQAFCLEHSKIREAIALFKLMNEEKQ